VSAVLVMDSPIGGLRLRAEHGALTAVGFDADPAGAGAVTEDGPADPADRELVAEAGRQLAAYFAGDRHDFDLPLAPRGTAFQQRVWDHLLTVGWGTTTTYGAIAAALGLPPGASRAVGAANGANPIPVIVPCHRVIGADGTLTGYAGGLPRKATLLHLEGVRTEADQFRLF